MKKTSKRVIVISALSFLVFIIIGGLIAFSEFGDNGKISYIDFEQKDYYNFQTIGKHIFNKIDIAEYENHGSRFEYVDEFVKRTEDPLLISAAEGEGINDILELFDSVKKIEREVNK